MELSEAVKYVAAAYLVVWLAILVYLLLIGQKVGRLERDLDRLEAQVERGSVPVEPGPTPVGASTVERAKVAP
jgi:CcmD family protein